MADFQGWERQLLPQGGLVAPQTGPSLAEAFGSGLSGLANATAATVESVRKTNEWRDEKQWEIDQPKIAKEIAQAGIDFAAFYADAKVNAPADLSGLQDQVTQWWDARNAAIAKNHSGQRAQDYINLYTADLKGEGVTSAIQDSTLATIRVRGDTIQSVVDLEANRVSSNPGAYKHSLANVMATLDAQDGAVPEAQLNEWRTGARRGLTVAMLAGQVDRDPQAALHALESGDYDADLDPTSKATLIKQAQAGINALQAQTRQKAQETATANQAAMTITYRDAVSTARATGKQTLITDEKIRNTWGGTAQGDQIATTMIRELHAAETQGQLMPVISSNDPAENVTLLQSLGPEGKNVFTTQDSETLQLASDLIKLKEAAFHGADPGAAAAAYSPNIAQAWATWQNDPTNKAQLKTAMALSELEQARQGVVPEKRKPMPEAVAAWIADKIAQEPNPKAKLDALLQFADLGDAESSKGALAQISRRLPAGMDLVVDIADPLGTGQFGDRLSAEKVLSALTVDTQGVELPQKSKQAITSTFNDGIGAVIRGQAAITGNLAAAAGLITPLQKASEQVAKAKILTGAEPAVAGREAVSDLTKQYATISDNGLAQIYYPRALEDMAPGAVEAGLEALREDAASMFKTPDGTPDPYLDATRRDVAESAIWINHGAGFALIVPGSSRFIKTATLEEVQRVGLQKQRALADAKRSDPPLTDFGSPFVAIE